MINSKRVQNICRSACALLLAPICLAGCGGFVTQMTPSPQQSQVAYVANALDDTITMYTIEPSTGQLQPKGTVVTGGSVPVAIAAHPSGRFAYVVNIHSGDVTAFAINSESAALTP